MNAPALRFTKHGIEVAHGLLWLDATKPRPFGVVSHAHADHVGRHETILCTPETAALVRRRSGPGPRFLERRYGESEVVGDLAITLLPAGHILGSAMVHVQGPGGAVLYTGDFKLRGGLTCAPAEPRKADVLVTEATFGKPEFRWDPDESRQALIAFANDALAAGETPVFLAYSLGKGQEVMTALSRAEIPVAAHGSVWNICSVYRHFGHVFKASRKLTGKGQRRAAIVVPPRWVGTTEVQRCAPLRIAAVTGWGGRATGGAAEHVIRLSDHADYDELVALVAAVKPTKVYTLHGYAEEFASDLRERGYDAEAVPGHHGPAEGVRPGMFE